MPKRFPEQFGVATSVLSTDKLLLARSGSIYGIEQSDFSSSALPFVTVGPAGSGASIVCDGVADEVQIQQAIDTGSPVRLLEGSYVISGEILLDSGTTITGAGKGQTTLAVSGITTGSIFRTRTLASRIYRVTISGLRMTKTYDAGHSTKALDFSQISISVFKEIEMSGFNYGVYASGSGTYYNNFYDMTATSCDYSYYIATIANENRFYGGRSDNAVINAIYLASVNTVTFFGVSFEGTDQSISLVSAEDCGFFGCRFEMYGTSGLVFDSASIGNMIFGGHFEGTTTFTDNGKNTILNGQSVRSDIKGNDNTDGRKYEHKGAGQNTNAVHTTHSSYANSGNPAIYRGIARRFDSMIFEGIYDDGVTQKRSFGVDANTGNIYTLSPDGNAWLIGVSNAGAITVTSTSTFTL